jgi:hypothetical protein
VVITYVAIHVSRISSSLRLCGVLYIWLDQYRYDGGRLRWCCIACARGIAEVIGRRLWYGGITEGRHCWHLARPPPQRGVARARIASLMSSTAPRTSVIFVHLSCPDDFLLLFLEMHRRARSPPHLLRLSLQPHHFANRPYCEMRLQHGDQWELRLRPPVFRGHGVVVVTVIVLVPYHLSFLTCWATQMRSMGRASTRTSPPDELRERRSIPMLSSRSAFLRLSLASMRSCSFLWSPRDVLLPAVDAALVLGRSPSPSSFSRYQSFRSPQF